MRWREVNRLCLLLTTLLKSQHGSRETELGPRRLALQFVSLCCQGIPTSCPDCWFSLCYLLAAYGFIGLLRRPA